MSKHQWITISSAMTDSHHIDTCVMAIPSGGVVMRYRMYETYDDGKAAVSLVFLPNAMIQEFTPEPEEE